MERLPHDPRNFRDIVEADLRRAARLVIKVQDEIDPQFRFATPEGDFHLPVMLPADLYGRKVIFRAITLLFAWKQAFGYTLASELHRPDSVLCVGFMGKERYACLSASRDIRSPGRRRILARSSGCRTITLMTIRSCRNCCRMARGK